MFKIKDLLKIIAFPFFVYMLGYSLQASWDNYQVLWWPNRVVHLLGGLSFAVVGYFILDIFKKLKWISTSSKVVDFFIILFFVMSVAVLWEFREFLSDKYLHTNSQISVADTIKDMFMGMVGAVLFGVGWFFKLILRTKLGKI